MFTYPNREKFAAAVQQQLEPNIYKHSLALEACMAGLYDYFAVNNLLGANEPPKEEWLLAGLVHDIDYSGEYKPFHPTKTLEVLQKYGLSLPENVHHIVKVHAPAITGQKQETKADWAIFCADSLTGLIVATALVYPSKKLADVKLSSVMKRLLKEPRFAAGTRREEIKMCSDPQGLNLPAEKFVEICLNSMKAIAPELGV